VNPLLGGTWWETRDEFRERLRRTYVLPPEPAVQRGECHVCGREIVDPGKVWIPVGGYAVMVAASQPIFDVCSFRCALAVVESMEPA